MCAPVQHWPPYAAHFTLEVYQSASAGASVRILYNGKPMIMPFSPNRNEYCPLSAFKAHVASLKP